MTRKVIMPLLGETMEEGRIVSWLKNIGDKVEKQFENDIMSELDAVRSYNEGIKLCREVGDNGTEQLLKKHLAEEEEHLDWIESQVEQIKQIGIQNYLSMQVKDE